MLIHRRLLAALCVGVAVAITVSAHRPPEPASVQLWTAARDLPSGTVLAAGDLRRTAFTPQSAPAAAVRAEHTALGRTLAAPLARGEAATSADLVGDGLLARYPGQVAVPVRIPDGDVVAMLRVGDRIDLIASDPQGRQGADRLLAGAPVIAVPEVSRTGAGPGIGGRLLVVGAPAGEATRVAEAATTRYLTVIWTR